MSIAVRERIHLYSYLFLYLSLSSAVSPTQRSQTHATVGTLFITHAPEKLTRAGDITVPLVNPLAQKTHRLSVICL